MSTLSSALKTTASGLAAERFRMDVISSNIANANTMRVNGKDPFRRLEVVLAPDRDGVKVVRTVEDQAPFRVVHEPGNPFADAEGNVIYSNVEPIYEMVNMISASRSYEANIAAFNSARTMIRSALSIGKV
ncbi:MAG: flagellar basal body rod protein FlgC [Armatimonadetes bacterium]|uniref:Flagellar basal-body rod protein FlgC n=1 Tax=Candidatus Nitrosymbiomonas proteolyticus TaxID=2608984 RepID=A0A809R9V3_9BACT|nr:MAG: flagellar basal body rod protein FlgC [Armatimonadota bacterium]MCK6631809.1 flagellar basal body rod protein FlgC [Fimbriimonadaceae bacterium]BBO24229.1 flagellar basal-body rod protein FlgC [Candidatus Nitrosymbiomonas proteolyticus]MBL1153161.1 flagellar basal body rod protein FlgC [Armatimonadota bacterium]NOG39820.1 flagellar basal body rod protein FlgC [Armatimonadota bacterium]